MDEVYIREVGPQHGRGVFAARDFEAGEVLFRATGRAVDHQTEHSIQIGWDLHVDVDPPARYLNHACDPNAGVKTGVDGLPIFIARRRIRRGDEIRYDYAMTEFRHYERAHPDEDFDLTCHCGSPRCRGTFGYYSKLSEALRTEYAGFIAEYLVQQEVMVSL